MMTGFFSYDVEGYAANLTEQSHQTLNWLHRHNYINDEQYLDLMSRMVVIPIRNKPSFGQRILNRFFSKDAGDDVYVFPITLLEEYGSGDNLVVNDKQKSKKSNKSNIFKMVVDNGGKEETTEKV